jgi:hypothetical protein
VGVVGESANDSGAAAGCVGRWLHGVGVVGDLVDDSGVAAADEARLT